LSAIVPLLVIVEPVVNVSESPSGTDTVLPEVIVGAPLNVPLTD
jgi:hypothetical protein